MLGWLGGGSEGSLLGWGGEGWDGEGVGEAAAV